MERNILESIDDAELGRRLKQARLSAGLTQADAAGTVGVARTTLIAIEQGGRRIKAGELIELAHAYGCQVSDLVRPRPVALPFSDQFRCAKPDPIESYPNGISFWLCMHWITI